jgi:predicted RNA-binding protein with PIN domain
MSGRLYRSIRVEMILLVDGYNVIHRVPELEKSLDGGLQNARNRLALQVSSWSRAHPGVECVIVFDGEYQGHGSREERIAGIRCVFSMRAHGGDAELIRFVRDHKGRKPDITVVSDDNNVGNNCRAHGAVVRPSGFILGVKAPRPRGGGKAPSEGKGLDRKAAAAIDEELKKKFGV